jgi:hypothetical protein
MRSPDSHATQADLQRGRHKQVRRQFQPSSQMRAACPEERATQNCETPAGRARRSAALAQDRNPHESEAHGKPFAPPDLASRHSGDDGSEQRHGGDHDRGSAGADRTHAESQHPARETHQHRTDQPGVANLSSVWPDRVATRGEDEQADARKQVAQAG